MSITTYYLDLIPGFGIRTVKLWTPLQGRGTSTITGFVRHLTLFLGLWGTCGLAARKVLWLFRFGVLLHFGLCLQRTVLTWLILVKIGWTCPPWRRLFARVATALVLLAEGILILGFWLFVLISDLRGFLLLVFALATKVGAVSVHLLSCVSALFYFIFPFLWGIPLWFFRWVDGFEWSEVSGWPSGSQWVAYADSFRIICFSQWVACT